MHVRPGHLAGIPCRTFGPVQNVQGDIRSTPKGPWSRAIRYHVGHGDEEGVYWQYIHGRIIEPIKHDGVFLCTNLVNQKYK